MIVRHAPILLERDCQATRIPSGDKIELKRGDEVRITQALGGSFTLTTASGYLVRIGATDADALGRDLPEVIGSQLDRGDFHIDHVIDQLKEVFDPEIPINVVDLGLIYFCEAQPLPGGGHRVEIQMSMTAPGCGMGDVLRMDAISKVETIPGVSEVAVDIVWDPPWDTSRMSEGAKLQLGIY